MENASEGPSTTRTADGTLWVEQPRARYDGIAFTGYDSQGMAHARIRAPSTSMTENSWPSPTPRAGSASFAQPSVSKYTLSDARAVTNSSTRIENSLGLLRCLNKAFRPSFQRRRIRVAGPSPPTVMTTPTTTTSSPFEPHQAPGSSLAGPQTENKALCYLTVHVIGAVLDSAGTAGLSGRHRTERHGGAMDSLGAR